MVTIKKGGTTYPLSFMRSPGKELYLFISNTILFTQERRVDCSNPYFTNIIVYFFCNFSLSKFITFIKKHFLEKLLSKRATILKTDKTSFNKFFFAFHLQMLSGSEKFLI